VDAVGSSEARQQSSSVSTGSITLPKRQAKAWSLPACGGAEMHYESDEHGSFSVGPAGMHCSLRGGGHQGCPPWQLNLRVDGQLRRWAPEGWLGSLWRLRVLPCRYLIHTLCTPAHYALHAPSGLGQPGPSMSVEGDGVAHIETNFGEAFPEAWLYAQGHATTSLGQPIQLLIVGGRFKIGPVLPLTWLLCLKLPGWPQLEFRTTDLDSVHVRHLSFADGKVVLEAARPRWRRGKRSAQVTVHLSAPRSSFGRHRLFVPTTEGFTRTPGTVESFAARAEVCVSSSNGVDAATETFVCSGCLLEFGGTFQQEGAL